MIKVVVKKNAQDVPYDFNISGHAMYDNYGKDIVCAAVSVLTITIANSMLEYCKDEAVVMQNSKNATISIKIPKLVKDKVSKEVVILSKTLLLGLLNIEEEYGNKYISVKEEVTND